MNPRDALHQQQMLCEAMSYPQQQRYLHDVLTDIADKRNGPTLTDDAGKITGQVNAEALARLLSHADTFYVSEDMALVAQAASHGLDGIDRFTHDMWPSDYGFLLFERGFVVDDVWGRPLVTSAIAWERRGFEGMPGTLVYEFTMLGDERDPMTVSMTPQQLQDMATGFGSRLQLHTTGWIADGRRVGPPIILTPADYAEKHLSPDFEAQLLKEHRATSALTYSSNPTRTIMALLMLMQQKIAAKERHDLRPKNPKRARRMKVPGQVTIIRLRHEASQREPGETNVEWQHRWLVRGHWRWQNCGPGYPMAVEISPGEFRSRIYIAPFVKGNPNAPFAINKKVTALIR